MTETARNLEIDGPSASCGYCHFTSSLRGTWSVEDGRLVWRGDESPQPGRGPDLNSCCEGRECGDFAGITAEGVQLPAEDVAALRETDIRAEMRDCPWRFPGGPDTPEETAP